MRKEKKFNYIYLITNMINDTYYIGMHSTDNLDDGYFGSGKRLKYSINKYGKESFLFEKLYYYKTRKEVRDAEEKLVCCKLLQDPLCLNLRTGGEGGDTVTYTENPELARQRNKGWFDRFTELEKIEYKEKVKAGVKKWKDEHPEKFDERQQHVKATRMNKGSYNHSEETKKLIAINNKSSSQEVRDKISKTILGRIWIKKENNSKQIDKNELSFYISEGWTKGRIVTGYKQKLQVEVLKQKVKET